MTDPIAQARAEERAEGIREAAETVASLWAYRTCQEVTDAILALLDAPAPTQPAQVSVSEAAKLLLGVVERREWTHYPIEMPLNANMQGPAKVGKDAYCMTYEVWKADTLRPISDHNKLPEAIASWLRALSEETRP
jgi:hypothetical protein